ncbi:hypothetical protein Q8A73_006562 [Channa argus]|nr:hypothetical protein Q8A73_006562 [Channa argus]
MDMLISFLGLLTLPQLVVPQVVPYLTTLQAEVEIVSGESRIFTGESVHLRCSITDKHRSTWRYLWFKGSEELNTSGENYRLERARVKDSGKFYCQGVRDSLVGDIHTSKSLPVEITVDGGWAILQIPNHPTLVGNNLNVRCHVRGNPALHEVVLYKDGVEVMTQTVRKPDLYLTNLSVEDQGMYSCRASWDIERRTRSVISAEVPVQVLEVLSKPILEIATSINLLNKMKLICHVQYNAPAPAHPINYYFYKNNIRLGVATSENHDLVNQIPGQYSCKAKVPMLNLSRSSEPKSFGIVKGGQRQDSRFLWTPPVSSPDLSPPAATEPTAAQHSPDQSMAAPSFIQSTEVSIQPSDPFLNPSKPEPSPLLSTVLSHNQISINVPQESGDMSGDMSSDLAFTEQSVGTSE